MKATSFFVLSALCLAGAACSQPKAAEPLPTADVAQSSDTTGKLNLPLPGSATEPASSGSINLGTDTLSEEDDGLLIGKDALESTGLEDASDLTLNLDPDGEAAEDDLVRLPAPN